MESIQQIPLTALRESPFNPRRTFNESGLQELAADMKAQGILSPLLVRPYLPNVLRTVHDPADGYELVFGHRRLRSAVLAGLTEAPCMVRAMSDDDARQAQLSENLSREDVHPIEEAEGFQAMIQYGHTNAEGLVTLFGKSRSYIYGRLKLLQACKQVRDACLEGRIGSEVALLIARLRTEKLQHKALGRIEGKFLRLEDGGRKSFRAIRELLVEHFTLDLDKPMFDPCDALLLPDAGTCGACPKRVGNAPEYEDLLEAREGHWSHQKIKGNPDVCTDPDCYEEKKKAHLRNQAATLQQGGEVVVDGAKARAAIGADGKVKGAYIALSDVKKELATAKKAGTVAQVVTIQDPRTGKVVKAVKRADLVAAGVKDVAPKQDLEAERKKREAEHERLRVKAQAEQNARLNVLRAIRVKLQATERSAFDMTLIAKTAFRGVEYWAKPLLSELWEVEEVSENIDTMTPDELMVFMFDCALISDCLVRGRADTPEDLLKVAGYYGIDVAVARGDQPAGNASTPSTAARAQKKAGGKAVKKNSAIEAWDKTFPRPDGADQTDDAGCAGDEAKDEPADAGVERDPNTSDMFEDTPT